MYYAGLDVASKGSFLYVQDRKGRKEEGREILTIRWAIEEAFKKYDCRQIEVAIEAGGSTRWIYDTLKEMGIRVYVVNPVRELRSFTLLENSFLAGRAVLLDGGFKPPSSPR